MTPRCPHDRQSSALICDTGLLVAYVMCADCGARIRELPGVTIEAREAIERAAWDANPN